MSKIPFRVGYGDVRAKAFAEITIEADDQAEADRKLDLLLTALGQIPGEKRKCSLEGNILRMPLFTVQLKEDSNV